MRFPRGGLLSPPPQRARRALRPSYTPPCALLRRRRGRFIQGAGVAALQLEDLGVDALVRLNSDHHRAVVGSSARSLLCLASLPKPRP
jgi:hypothetical protein